MAGKKWEELKKKYPMIQLSGEHADKVNAIRAAYRSMSQIELTALFRKKEEAESALEEQLGPIQAELEALEWEIIGRMEEADITQIKYEDGLTFYLSDNPQFKVFDVDAFYQWIQDSDLEGEFPRTVNSQTIASRCRERINDRDSQLPAGVEVSEVRTKLCVRGRPKRG